jgi:eukaryotic-like serine/threonine-protein kinase
MDDAVHVPGYALERELGRGDHGVVWAAWEEASGHRVAIKLLPIREPRARSQAVREAALLAAVDHPHLVPLYGAVEVAEGIALIMQLADGGNLTDLLSVRGPLPAGEAVTVCAPIAQGLAEAHRHGMVHGDIRPENVLFTTEGRPMLSDLGVGRLTRMERRAGGAGFAAPEAGSGHAVTPAADVYGMAVLTVVALTGHLPARPLVLPGLPPATFGMLARSLELDPSRRPDAESFANAVFALADPEPISFEPEAIAAAPAPAPIPIPVSPAGTSEDDQHTDDLAGASRRARRPSRRIQEEAEAEPAPAEPKEPEGRNRSRKRDVLGGLAIVLMLPVIAFGVYVVWNQFTGGNEDELPQAGRATAIEGVDGSTELCGGPHPVPTNQPPEAEDWANVVEHLYSQLSTAFADLNSELLCEVYSPTHPRLARDYEALQAYAESGVEVVGLRYEVIDTELISHESGLVVLEITDRITPYQLVDAEGEVVDDRAGAEAETWEMELVPSSDGSGWRIG